MRDKKASKAITEKDAEALNLAIDNILIADMQNDMQNDFTFYAISQALNEVLKAKEYLRRNSPVQAFETLQNAEHILMTYGNEDAAKRYLKERA